MSADPWLDRWLPLVRARAGSTPVLELGCGPGLDTRTLTDAGLAVVAIDKSPDAVAEARIRAPAATISVGDLLHDLPSVRSGFNVALASLSLHYFGWRETVDLFGRVRAVLSRDGLLIGRLNSTDDHHFGASGHPPIEPRYYRVDGEPKRFFDRADIETLMRDGWTVLALEHRVTDKYVKPKALWELVAERSDD